MAEDGREVDVDDLLLGDGVKVATEIDLFKLVGLIMFELFEGEGRLGRARGSSPDAKN